MRVFCQHRPGWLRRVVGPEDLKQSQTECKLATTGRDGCPSSQAVTAQSGSLYAVLMYVDVDRRPYVVRPLPLRTQRAQGPGLWPRPYQYIGGIADLEACLICAV